MFSIFKSYLRKLENIRQTEMEEGSIYCRELESVAKVY